MKILFILLISFIISNGKKSKKNKTQKKTDDISSLYIWAKKNNIFINENLVLNKNKDTDLSHNFYYFSPKEIIPNNTVLLRVNYDTMISQSILENILKEAKNQKFIGLWDKIIEIDNYYISYFSTKQLFYISILIENAINKKKGPIYKKYGPYLDMYDYINLDNFPIFFEGDEIYYLSLCNFGYHLTKAVKSLEEEYYILKYILNITNSIQENFKKYRVLALANSISLNNTNLKDKNDFNETIIIPFIDCFKKRVSETSYNAKHIFRKSSNNTYYLEIISTKQIEKGDEIYLKWKKLPNSDCLLYYGFIEEGNSLLPKYYIDIFNRAFKKKMGINMNTSFADVMEKSMYELSGSELFSDDVIGSYKNLSQKFEKYSKKDEGYLEMMKDNLQFYKSLYTYQYTDGNINLYITGNDKRKYIKEIIRMEQRMIDYKMNSIEKLIEKIKNQTKNYQNAKNINTTNTDL